MELKRKVETVIASGSLHDLVRQAQFGDTIILVEDCKGLDDWRPHPEGVATRHGKNIWLNRQSSILKLKQNVEGWDVSSQGEIFAQYGEDVVCVSRDETVCKVEDFNLGSGWAICKAGVIVQNTFGGPLLLHGTKEIHPGGKNAWAPYRSGFVITEDNLRKRFLFNGKKVICQGDWDNWGTNPKGIIIQRGNDLLLNGKALIHRIQDNDTRWGGHFDGVAVEDNGKIILVIT